MHLARSVKPSVHLDEWIGQLKGGSSFEMGEGLQWQAGYGIVSFGTRDLEWVVKYIHNQRSTLLDFSGNAVTVDRRRLKIVWSVENNF